LQGARVGLAAETETAVLLGDHEAEEPRLAQLRDELRGQLALPIPLLEVRLARAEQLRDRAEHALERLLVGCAELGERQHDVLFDLPHAERAHEARRLAVDHDANPNTGSARLDRQFSGAEGVNLRADRDFRS
jgi:hypothetical protein